MQRKAFKLLVPLIALGAMAVSPAGGKPQTAPARDGVDPKGSETLAVMERHAEAMKSRDVERIVADYADDTVVIATLFPKPIIGKDALRRAVVEALKIPPLTQADTTKFTTKEAVGELGYQIFENAGLSGTETYVVRNGKIVFETANIALKQPATK